MLTLFLEGKKGPNVWGPAAAVVGSVALSESHDGSMVGVARECRVAEEQHSASPAGVTCWVTLPLGTE